VRDEADVGEIESTVSIGKNIPGTEQEQVPMERRGPEKQRRKPHALQECSPGKSVIFS
jgi:hypothetical protein